MYRLLLTIPQDKLRHAFVGVLLSISFIFIPAIYALTLSILFAAAKEIKDKISKTGNAEIQDFLYTILSPVITYICLQFQ